MRHALKRGFLAAAFAAVSGAVVVSNAVPGVIGGIVLGAALGNFVGNLGEMLPVRLREGARAPLSTDEIALLKSVFGRKLATA
ncbi:MAG: hypothetical protein KGQ70_03285, partial [Alphaproteobacteria bacterium]|nr:hypothetical protein [Alphaproteobacteria bacterium]